MKHTLKTLIVKKAMKMRDDANEVSLDYVDGFPEEFAHSIKNVRTTTKYTTDAYVFPVKALLGCPKKVQLELLAEKEGAEITSNIRSKWAIFRGNVWDKVLSEMFPENQVLFTVMFKVNGKPVFIRGRIDAITQSEDGRKEVIDFKTVNDEKLNKRKYLKPEYIFQIAFYAKIIGAEKYSILAVANKDVRYASFDDEQMKNAVFKYVKTVAEEIVKSLEEKRITNITERRECLYCPFRGRCDEIQTYDDFKRVLNELVDIGVFEL